MFWFIIGALAFWCFLRAGFVARHNHYWHHNDNREYEYDYDWVVAVTVEGAMINPPSPTQAD